MGNIFSNKNFTNRFFNTPEMGGPLKATDSNNPDKEKLTSSTSTKEGNWQTGTNTTRTNTFSSTSGGGGGGDSSSSSTSGDSVGGGGGGSSSTGKKNMSNPKWSAFLKTSQGQAYTANRASSNSNTTNRTETLSYSTKGVSASSVAPTAETLKTSVEAPPKPSSGTTGPPPPDKKTKKYKTPLGKKLKRFVKKVTKKYTLNPFAGRGRSSNKRVGSNAGCRNCR
jgi:hypothetical protein|tara:strand:+ start:437 stop:1108 length:672 start_codon:yes stop_codon:yes gene_type:complete